MTNQLQQIIINKIKASANQVIDFADFMDTVLYYPDLGFYSNNYQKFGQQGHFITATTIGNILAQSLAKQILEIFSFSLATNTILEIGAGSGKLASDILSLIGNEIDKLQILELNQNLISAQKTEIYNNNPDLFHKIEWIGKLPDHFNGIIIGNEVLDAIPCQRVLIDNNGQDIIGLGVGYDQNKLVDKYYNLELDIIKSIKSYELKYNNYITEFNPSAIAFIKTIANIINQGAVIFIDYGYGQKEYYAESKYLGRLRGFYQHQVYADFYSHLGLMDITADVNFTEIAVNAIAAGLELIGYNYQKSFILNTIPDVIANIGSDFSKNLGDKDKIKMMNQIQTLLSPSEMGDAFKVIAFSKNIEADNWLGFNNYDISHRL